MELVDRLGKLMAVPHKTRPMMAFDLLRKQVDQVGKSYRMIKGQLNDRGLDMDIYILRG